MHWHRTSAIGAVSFFMTAWLCEARVSNPSSIEITAPPPEPTLYPRAEDPDVKVITVTANMKDGYRVGDVVIVMPQDLADKVNLILDKDPSIIAACSDGLEGGIDFKNLKPGSVNKRSVPHAEAICGSESLVGDVIPPGPLALLHNLDMGALLMRGADSAEALARVVNYAKNVLVARGVSEIQARKIGTTAFFLAWVFYEKHTRIKNFNVLKADTDVNRSTPKPTKQCTGTMSKCIANCRMLGASMLNCSTKCQEQTSTEECGRTSVSTPITISTASVTPWIILPPPPPPPAPSALCPDGDSGFPAVDLSKIAESDFCGVASKRENPVSKPYDGAGDDFHPITGPFGSPNEVNLKLFRVDLSWKPDPNGVRQCAMNCIDAYRFLANSDCGKKGDNNFLTNTGQINVGCGVYSYDITPPPKLGRRKCFGKFGHGDVRGDDLGNLLRVKPPSDQRLVGSKGGNIILQLQLKNTIYSFRMEWIPGCVSNVDPMDSGEPIPGVYWNNLLFDNWKMCDNAGAGGYIDAGCLRYTFTPKTRDELKKF